MEEGLAVAAARKKLLEKRAEQAARLPEQGRKALFPWCAIPSDLGYIVRPRALPSLTSPRGMVGPNCTRTVCVWRNAAFTRSPPMAGVAVRRRLFEA